MARAVMVVALTSSSGSTSLLECYIDMNDDSFAIEYVYDRGRQSGSNARTIQKPKHIVPLVLPHCEVPIAVHEQNFEGPLADEP